MESSTRRRSRSIGFGVLGVLLAIQLVPYGRDHINPSATMEPMWDSPTTRALTKQACFDCHSNETKWPAYSNIAPVSWLIQRDVNQGRRVLNFSEWERSHQEAVDAVEEVREGEMPPVLYMLMHGHARLNASEREQLTLGLAKTIGASAKEHERWQESLVLRQNRSNRRLD